MNYVELVAILAVLQFLVFGGLVGRERVRSGLKAPAVTGDEGFERMYRVQMNTLETLIAFLPVLFIAGRYWSGLLIAGIGVVYLVGRTLYCLAYMTDPSKRGPGFMLSFLPTVALTVLALLGVVLSFAR